MIIDFVRISWAQRGIYGAVVGTLATAALVIASLALIASALVSDAGGGDVTPLRLIGGIAVVCTVVVLRAIAQHGVVERWPMMRAHRRRKHRIMMLGYGHEDDHHAG